MTAINTYDEYGRPAAANVGRFQYTGQMWLPEAGLYNYKARAYEPNLGRFLQTDPVGYEAGLNLYAYVGNDPVNATDPTGMLQCVTRECRTQAQEALENTETGLGAALSTTEQAAARNGSTAGYATASRVAGGAAVVAVQGAGAVSDLQNGAPVDTVVVERGARTAGALVVAAEGAKVGAAVGSGIAPGPGTTGGAIVGGIIGGLLGDSGGKAIGDGYRAVRNVAVDGAQRVGSAVARGFDDYISRISGYRPYGTR